MTKPATATTRRRVSEYRKRLRAQGLRPIQVWVPDVRTPQFAEQARLEGLAAARSPSEADDQAFVDAVTDWSE